MMASVAPDVSQESDSTVRAFLGVYEAVPLLDGIVEEMQVPLPLGPEGLRQGALPNGLKFYLRRCQKPKDRLALALVVRVGSVMEEEHEQGVAHIVEHLAFNATENYSNHDLVKLLESIGAPFGACQNAQTGPDDTIYTFTVPTTAWEKVEAVVDVLGEIAFKIRCAPEDLERERGAVLEEWRMSRDATARQQRAHWTLLLQGSKYAERLPIGTEHIIRHVSADVVRQFYQRWYRPEHMAVVAVGDLSDDQMGEMEALLQRVLVGQAAPAHTPRPALPVVPFTGGPSGGMPKCCVFADPEMTSASVFATFTHPRSRITTPADYRNNMRMQLFTAALGTRLYKMSQEEDPPFYSAAADVEPLTASTTGYTLSATCIEGRELLALEALLREVARVRLHGFAAREMERVRRDMRAQVEAAFLQAGEGYMSDYRDEYVRHFLLGEMVTGEVFEASLSKTLLEGISDAEVAAEARCFDAAAAHCVLKATGHRRRAREADLAAVWRRVRDAEQVGALAPWRQAEGPDVLMAAPPPPGSIVSERVFPRAMGAVEWTLSNGMRVAFKESSHMRDEVLLTGFAAGGLSEEGPQRFLHCSLARVVANQLGVFGLRPHEVGDVLAGRRVALDVSAAAYCRAFAGLQSRQHLDTAMQLLHLLFTTTVSVVSRELSSVLSMTRQLTEAQYRDPAHAFVQRVQQLNYGDCYYFQTLTPQMVDELDVEAAAEYHNRSFRNPAEFTVVFTGDVSRALLAPLVVTYLASIPAVDSPAPLAVTSVTPLPWAFPQEPVVEDVQVAMVSPVTELQVTLPVALTRSRVREEGIWLHFACRLLETRLLQHLRFRKGKIYSVSVSPNFSLECASTIGDARGDVAVVLTCDPALRHNLRTATLEELTRLQEEVSSGEEVATLLQHEALQFENSLSQNNYWHEVLVTSYQSRSFVERAGELDVLRQLFLDARDQVRRELSPEALREAFQRLLPYPATSRYTAVAMVPQLSPLNVRAALTLLANDSATQLSVAAALLAVLAAGALLYRRYTRH